MGRNDDFEKKVKSRGRERKRRRKANSGPEGPI
jgi:hypothetical protein